MVYIQGESKKVWLARRLVENFTFFVQLSCIVFFQYFFDFFLAPHFSTEQRIEYTKKFCRIYKNLKKFSIK